jgi:hypothetical protein
MIRFPVEFVTGVTKFYVHLRLTYSSDGLAPTSHLADTASVASYFMSDSQRTKWHWREVFSDFFSFPCKSSFHHCSILIYHDPLGYAVSLTTQHSITSSVFNLGLHP